MIYILLFLSLSLVSCANIFGGGDDAQTSDISDKDKGKSKRS